jgi:hypothetical protein
VDLKRYSQRNHARRQASRHRSECASPGCVRVFGPGEPALLRLHRLAANTQEGGAYIIVRAAGSIGALFGGRDRRRGVCFDVDVTPASRYDAVSPAWFPLVLVRYRE